MIWVVLVAVLFVGWNCLILLGKVGGTLGIFLVLMLGFAAVTVLIYGSLASIAFAVGLPLAAWALTLLMISQLAYLAWSTFEGLR